MHLKAARRLRRQRRAESASDARLAQVPQVMDFKRGIAQLLKEPS